MFKSLTIMHLHARGELLQCETQNKSWDTMTKIQYLNANNKNKKYNIISNDKIDFFGSMGSWSTISRKYDMDSSNFGSTIIWTIFLDSMSIDHLIPGDSKDYLDLEEEILKNRRWIVSNESGARLRDEDNGRVHTQDN